jgi:hypothetical protein
MQQDPSAHEHHKGKGECTTCSAHKLNTSARGHLVYVHGKNGCINVYAIAVPILDKNMEGDLPPESYRS